MMPTVVGYTFFLLVNHRILYSTTKEIRKSSLFCEVCSNKGRHLTPGTAAMAHGRQTKSKGKKERHLLTLYNETEYSWPLNNTGIKGADPCTIHIELLGPQTSLLIAYC